MSEQSVEGAADTVARQSRREVVDRQLARSDQYWARAVTELREGLIGMAGQLDELDRRVRDLEARKGL